MSVLGNFWAAMTSSAQIKSLTEKVNELMRTQAQLVTDLNAVISKVQKIGDESRLTLVKVEELEAAVAEAGGLSEEVEIALAALKAQVQIVDDLVPDATP